MSDLTINGMNVTHLRGACLDRGIQSNAKFFAAEFIGGVSEPFRVEERMIGSVRSNVVPSEFLVFFIGIRIKNGSGYPQPTNLVYKLASAPNPRDFSIRHWCVTLWILSFSAIRSDENFREGLKSKKDITTILPFRENHIDKQGVFEILENSGLGLPKYYEWRSRSGCTFCFFQRKIEWVGLLERHPEAFENAKSLEKNAMDHGSPFTWSENESLEELSKPERIAEIKADHERKIEAQKKKRKINPLRPDEGLIDFDELYGQQKVCLACHK